MKKIISALLAGGMCFLGSASAFEAIQSNDTKNVFISGRLSQVSSDTITLRLFDEDGKTCYIGEIVPEKSGEYSTKFYYNGNAAALSFDLKQKGEKINDTVISAVSGTGEIVEADVFLTDEKGSSFIINSDLSRKPYTAGKFSYTPEISFSADTKAGVTIYPKNKLGFDNTKYSVFIAEYDETGRLVGFDTLKSDELKFSDYSGKTAVVCKSITISEKTKTVKAFLWESEKTLVPYEEVADGKLEKTNLWLIGDSTWQGWGEKSYPQAGVGSFLGDYFNSENITVTNKAVSGSSAQSWLDSNPGLGNWSDFIPQVSEGDYVLICLGINDLCGNQSAEYVDKFKTGIEEMIRQLKDKKVNVILSSPILNAWKGSDEYVTFSNYLKVAAETLSEIAEREDIVYLPLSETSYEKFKSNTVADQCRLYHLDYETIKEDWRLSDDDLTNHMNSSIKSGKDDEMHINAKGADTFASMVAQLLLQSESKLKHYLK